MQLRPYQQENKLEITESFNEHQGVLYALPTRGGKTAVFADLIKDWIAHNKNVCIIAHREPLITQGANTIERITGIKAGIILAEDSTRPWSPVQVCSIQSMRRRTLPVTPDYIIIDEAHLANAKSYINFLSKYPQAKRLLVTATPHRLDKKGFTEFASKIVLGPSVAQLLEMGFLAEPKMYTGSDVGSSLANVRTTMGDYKVSDLEELMGGTKIMGDIVGEYKAKAHGRKGVVFCPTVEHSKQVAKAFCDAGIPAEHIDGAMDKAEVKAVLIRLKEGTTWVVSNVDMLSEGWDEPTISYVGLARPTKSLSKYLQQGARGLTLCENKPDCVIIDHGNNIQEHGHILQHRNWTLAGDTHRDKVLKTHRECPSCGGWTRLGKFNCEVCGFEFPRQKRVVNTMLSNLDLVTLENAMLQRIRLDYIAALDLAGKKSQQKLKQNEPPTPPGSAYHHVVNKLKEDHKKSGLSEGEALDKAKKSFGKAVSFNESKKLIAEIYQPYLIPALPKKNETWLQDVVDKALAH